MKSLKIKSIKSIGVKKTFNLEMKDKAHNYIFFNGRVVSKNSHSIGYSLLSYVCAYLLTYHEKEWLCAYLESSSNNPDKKERAISEILKLGYEISKIDINHATGRWEIQDGKKFMPSITFIKGIKEKAVEELERLRPFETIYDFWDENGKWKFSKFNKTCLGNLIKIGAFSSMDLVGENKTFSNYRHMYKVLVEDNKFIKLKSWRQRLEQKILEYSDVEDWGKEEKLKTHIELTGEFNLKYILDDNLLKRFENSNILPLGKCSKSGVYWFILLSAEKRTTKTNKDYLVIDAIDSTNITQKIRIWNYNPETSIPFEKYGIFIAGVKKNEYGLSISSCGEQNIRKVKDAEN